MNFINYFVRFLTVCVITLSLITLNYRTAHAVVPLAYYLGYSVIGHVAVADGILAYLVYNLLSGTKKVNSSGDVAAPANVTWVDLSDPSTPAVKSKEVSVKMTKAEIQQKVSASPSSYPNLKNAIDTALSPSLPVPFDPSSAVGKSLTLNGKSYTVTNVGSAPLEWWFDSSYTAPQPNDVPFFYPGHEDQPDWAYVQVCVSSLPPYYETQRCNAYQMRVVPSVVDFATVIKNPDGTLKTIYDDEISRLIKSSTVDNGDVIDIKMGDGWPSGSNFNQPPAPTAAQIEAAGGVANGGGLVMTPGSQTGPDGSTVGGTGTTGTVTVNTDTPTRGEVQRKSLEFNSWRSLAGAVSQKYPFNQIDNLQSYLNPFLYESPTPPVIRLPIYGNNEIVVDLSPFDPVASVIRWAISLIMGFSVVFYIIRFYRGVS